MRQFHLLYYFRRQISFVCHLVTCGPSCIRMSENVLCSGITPWARYLICCSTPQQSVEQLEHRKCTEKDCSKRGPQKINESYSLTRQIQFVSRLLYFGVHACLSFLDYFTTTYSQYFHGGKHKKWEKHARSHANKRSPSFPPSAVVKASRLGSNCCRIQKSHTINIVFLSCGNGILL